MGQRLSVEAVIRIALVAVAVVAAAVGIASVLPAPGMLSSVAAEPTLTGTDTPAPTLPPTATRTLPPTPSATPTLGPPTATPTAIHAPAQDLPLSLSAPAIDLEAPVVSVPLATAGTLSAAVAVFAEGTTLPGHPGTTVVAITKGVATALDADWPDLRAGDELYLWFETGGYRYEIERVVRALPGADTTAWTDSTIDQRLTLLVGYPCEEQGGCWVYIARPAAWGPEEQP